MQNKLGHFAVHAAAFAGAKEAMEVILKAGTTKREDQSSKKNESADNNEKGFNKAKQHIKLITAEFV